MGVVRDEALAAFEAAADEPWWEGVRLKDVRDATLTPGGRARVTFFERVDDGRPHPRMRFELPMATDPAPPAVRLPDIRAPRTVDEAVAALRASWEAARPSVEPTEAELAAAPAGSERWYANSLRASRTAAVLDAVKERVAAWCDGLPEPERLRYALAALEDEAYAGDVRFDDADTGTYHGYQHDAPFVHWLELVLAGLPAEGSDAMELLDPAQQDSVRRQRAQAQAHLDWLMRHEFAFEGVRETDVERSVGGLLVDRETRQIVSEAPATAGTLAPAYELLVVASGPHEGQAVHRAGGALRLHDGTVVEVAEGDLRAEPVEPERLTFERAVGDPRLRPGVRLDWDGDGWLRPEPLAWVEWAGHCDVKAILEQLGVTLADAPTLTEHRSDTGETQRWSRELLLEALAATVELGSLYRTTDGEHVERGVRRFGGARNDALPDRLQFEGAGERSFRWPITGRQESFRVSALELGGEQADLGQVFNRYLPDGASFRPNPAYRETVDGDCNVIDVSGERVVALARVHSIDPRSGELQEEERELVLDLAPAGEGRQELGTHLSSAARREIFRVYLDLDAREVVAELDRWEHDGQRYVARPVSERTIRVPLAVPLRVTLSREARIDDPALLQTLLDAALRRAQNINADTEAQAAVWNGTVTRIRLERLSEDLPTRTERWRLDLVARFGEARLEYLLRRSATGEREATMPLDDGSGRSPDFLWQDLPDVGSKGVEGGRWVVNDAMLERDIVEVEDDRTAPGGIYVHDEHVKSTFEVLFAALGGYPYTLVHCNKRWGFRDEGAWQRAVDELARLRGRLTFAD